MILKLFRLAFKKCSLGKRPTRVGQKVVLEEGAYTEADETKPMEGSSFECGGTVRSLCRSGGIVHVEWCTGHTREFYRNMLRVISELEFKALKKKNFLADNPNYTFKQRQSTNSVVEEDAPPKTSLLKDSYRFGGAIYDSTSNNKSYVGTPDGFSTPSGNVYFEPENEVEE